MLSYAKATALIAALALSLSACSDARSTIDARHLVDTFAQAEIPITGVLDESERKCADPSPCIQVIVTEQVTVWRFSNRQDAAAHAANAANVHLSDYIVLEFEEGELTAEQQRDAASMVDSMHTSD